MNQLVAKRLELIQQAIPRADLVGLLVNPNNPNAHSDSKELLVADQNEHRPNDIRSSGYAQWVATGACNSRIHRRANPRIIPRGAAEKPDHGIAGCCARATNGHAAADPEASDEPRADSLDDLVGAGEHSGGNADPEVLAVLRLMTSSSWSGCWMGKSLGSRPLRLRPAYTPRLSYYASDVGAI